LKLAGTGMSMTWPDVCSGAENHSLAKPSCGSRAGLFRNAHTPSSENEDRVSESRGNSSDSDEDSSGSSGSSHVNSAMAGLEEQ
jgi:hypothetical protein